jgi:hypothetical protein
LRGQFWFGFGSSVTILTFLSALLLCHYASTHAGENRLQVPTTLNYFAWAILLLIYLPSLLQFSRGIIDLYHSNFIFNELAAPASGKIPLSDFSAQYSSVLGYPLLMISHFNASSVISFLPYYVTLLSLLVILALGSLLKILIPKIPLGVSLLFSSALVLVKQPESVYLTGSIAGLLSALPVRSLFPVLCAVILIVCIKYGFPDTGLVVLGVTAALSLINNFEFGITCVLALFLVLSALVILKLLRFKSYLLFAFSIVTILFLFISTIFLSGHEIQYGRWIVFSVGFGSNGFGNVPMPIFGTFILVFIVLGLGVVIGTSRLLLLRNQELKLVRLTRLPSACLALYGGLWGVLSLPYYIARSVNSGQLQIFLIPSIMVILGLVGFFMRVDDESLIVEIPRGVSEKFFSYLTLSFVLCLPFGSLLQHPDPSVEWSRVLGNGSEFSVNSISDSVLFSEIRNFTKSNLNSSVGLISNFSNLTALTLGISSVTDVNSLSDIYINQTLKESFCASISSTFVDFLIVVRADLKQPDILYFCQISKYQLLEVASSFDIYKIKEEFQN